jgi:Protein of unknown function (DUF4232)
MIARDPSRRGIVPGEGRRQPGFAPGIFRPAISAALTVVLLALAACGGSNRSYSTAGQLHPSDNRPHPSVASATAPSETVTAAPFAAAAACLTSHLSLTFARGAAAAGTAYTWYDLNNAGQTTCSMIGYPGVAVLNARGRIVQRPATRGAALPTPVRLVTLKPGRRAQFLLNSTDTIPSAGCPHAYRGVRLQVYPPNQRMPLHAPFTRPFCNLRVGPVEPAG